MQHTSTPYKQAPRRGSIRPVPKVWTSAGSQLSAGTQVQLEPAAAGVVVTRTVVVDLVVLAVVEAAVVVVVIVVALEVAVLVEVLVVVVELLLVVEAAVVVLL